ncbi:MAG: hypothetical protein MUC36_17195 [Planctomycetes bacterium]|jgi:hypothetical protein|nr:hypothetical protein [Planctomycetota bacterium]
MTSRYAAMMLLRLVGHLLAAPMLVLPTFAQTWSASAVAPVPGAANATITSNFAAPVLVNTSLPAGPVAAGQFVSAHATLGNSFATANAQWAPTFATLAGPVGFEVQARASVRAQPPPGMTQVTCVCDLAAALRITLQAPAPTAGRLVIEYLGVDSDVGNARIDVDLGDDGTIELVADNQTFQGLGNWRLFNAPLQIGAGGTPIRLLLTTQNGVGALGANSQQHGASITVRGHFLPFEPTVRPFDQTGAVLTLVARQSLANVVTLQAFAPNLVMPTVFVFGTVPLVASIPGLPTVTQLVGIDAWVVADYLTVPLPALPQGAAIYCQALGITSSGTLRSSNSVAAIWP